MWFIIKTAPPLRTIIAFMGGQLSAMDFMQAKMLKKCETTSTEPPNCITANISKTLSAVSRQKKSHRNNRKRRRSRTSSALSLRGGGAQKANEDASLSELCEMLEEKLSRSGLNHRLEKIIQIAGDIEAKNPKTGTKK